MEFDYFFLTLSSGTARAFADLLRPLLADGEVAGGALLGLFAPQLGWHLREAAVLIRWAPDAPGRESIAEKIAGLPGVASSVRHRLSPLARFDADALAKGGIFVHRWFDVAEADVAEFVALSQSAWAEFESLFDARVFGLAGTDGASGQKRILLLTRYGSHGVWEESRDPSTSAMATFMRRQLLTKDTWAASSLLVDV